MWIQSKVKIVRLNNITPFKAYFRMKPDLWHLYPFGCFVHVLIPKETRKKTFNPITWRCVFMGFSKHHDAFLFFDTKLFLEMCYFSIIHFHLYQNPFLLPLSPLPLLLLHLLILLLLLLLLLLPQSVFSHSTLEDTLSDHMSPNIEATFKYSGICRTGGETFDKGDGGSWQNRNWPHSRWAKLRAGGEETTHNNLWWCFQRYSSFLFLFFTSSFSPPFYSTSTFHSTIRNHFQVYLSWCSPYPCNRKSSWHFYNNWWSFFWLQ